MPGVKERSFKPNLDLKERYKKALQGLQDGTFKSVPKSAIEYELKKSSLAHRKNGRQSLQDAHSDEQVFSPAAERAIVRWILKCNDFGFPPRLDHLMQKIKFLAKNEHQQQVPMGRQQKHLIRKNWITHFLKHYLIFTLKFASRIDRQWFYENNPRIILNHFWNLANIIQKHNINPRAITNLNEKGLIVGYAKHTKVITRRGWKNPWVKQHGSHKFVTAVEAVSADGYIFPSFIFEKGKVHHIGWYQNVHAEDAEAYFAVSPKG